MKWIKIEEKAPPENIPILISNYEYLDKKKDRFFVVAERRGNIYQDPETDIDDTESHFFKPDYWCFIEQPSDHAVYPDGEGRRKNDKCNICGKPLHETTCIY
jgi:hypothetical protein